MFDYLKILKFVRIVIEIGIICICMLCVIIVKEWCKWNLVDSKVFENNWKIYVYDFYIMFSNMVKIDKDYWE